MLISVGTSSNLSTSSVNWKVFGWLHVWRHVYQAGRPFGRACSHRQLCPCIYAPTAKTEDTYSLGCLRHSILMHSSGAYSAIPQHLSKPHDTERSSSLIISVWSPLHLYHQGLSPWMGLDQVTYGRAIESHTGLYQVLIKSWTLKRESQMTKSKSRVALLTKSKLRNGLDAMVGCVDSSQNTYRTSKRCLMHGH